MVKRYGFFTALTMIVGIVIGSGIFFKSDNILVFTNGDVGMGVMLFCISALSIIFGALAIAELALKTDGEGGLVAYASQFYSHKLGSAFGWAQTFFYFPALTVVVGWVAGIYLSMLFPIPQTLEYQFGVGIGVIVAIYALNSLAPRIAGYFQISATVIKIIPLIAISIAGLFWGNGELYMTHSNVQPQNSTFLFAAIAPIAFSFDGWIISTSISQEIRNAKKNLTIALILAPIIILLLYLAYFIGISKLVGADKILELGDEHVYYAMSQLLGHGGAKAIVVFVTISVLGTLNGVILGSVRMPYALAKNNMFAWKNKLTNTNNKANMSYYSVLIAFVASIVWGIIHYLTQKFHLIKNSDISEMAIIAMYGLYIILYAKVIMLWRKKQIKSWFRGLVIPTLAIIGALFIVVGGVWSPIFFVSLAIVILIMSGGSLYSAKHKNKHKVVLEHSPLNAIEIAIDEIENENEDDKNLM